MKLFKKTKILSSTWGLDSVEYGNYYGLQIGTEWNIEKAVIKFKRIQIIYKKINLIINY